MNIRDEIIKALYASEFGDLDYSKRADAVIAVIEKHSAPTKLSKMFDKYQHAVGTAQSGLVRGFQYPGFETGRKGHDQHQRWSDKADVIARDIRTAITFRSGEQS